MRKIHARGKCFNPADFENLVIGGQNDADTIRFVIPKVFGNELDLSSWQWSIHYENKDGQGDTIALTATQSLEDENNLWIDWTPTQSATQVSGKLTCQVYAVKVAGSSTQRLTFHTFPIYVDCWLDPDPITQALPSVMEQALEEMAKYNADIQTAIQLGKEAAVHAQNAKDSENSASESAVEAAGSASSAAQSASDASASEEAAASSASSALASANNSANSATAAQTAKNDALSSKTASEAALSSVESLKAQVETIAAGSAVGTITIDGVLYTRALVFKNGIATITLTETEETESA